MSISVVLGIIGAIGSVPVILKGIQFLRSRSAARKLLRLQPKSKVDVVLTTSSEAISEEGYRVRRPMTGIGQITGTAAFSRAAGHFYPDVQITPHMSTAISNTLENDLIILGGPLRNPIASRFLASVSTVIPLSFDDRDGSIQLGDFALSDYAFSTKEDIPDSDICLVVCWRNPFIESKRRAILCAGMSSYGTAAGTDYLFRYLLFDHQSTLRDHLDKSGNGDFAMVLDVEFSRDQPISFDVLAFQKIVD